MAFNLRWYQTDAIAAIYEYFGRAQGNPLVCVSTGGGKSVIIAAFIQQVMEAWPNQRILVLAHVKEILEQNFDKITALWPLAPAGVYSAGLNRRDTDSAILFAGIQSVHKKAFDLGAFDLVIVDECHLINADKDDTMYTGFFRDMKMMNPKVKVIGFSATPYRMKSGLLTEGDSALFDEVVYETDIQRLIDEGFLSSLVTKGGSEKIDLTGVRTRTGEFVTKDLENAVHKNDVTDKAVGEILQYGRDRKAWLIFCVSVAHAEEVKELLSYEGISCECVHGGTPAAERERILKDYKAGKIRALTSQGVLTTGFDAPLTDMIALLRPTKSPGLYVQIMGRGLRISPETGKSNCLVLDYAGNVERHGPIDRISVDSIRKKRKGEPGEAPMKECPECNSFVLAFTKDCPDCGYQWPEKPQHEESASKAAVLASQIEAEWQNVEDVLYTVHQKKDKPPSLRVTYRCGFDSYSEWVCFEHSGFAQSKAQIWWFNRAGFQAPCPRTTADAIDKIEQQAVPFLIPSRILVRPEGKFNRIENYDMASVVGTPSEWNDNPAGKPKMELQPPMEVDDFSDAEAAFGDWDDEGDGIAWGSGDFTESEAGETPF
ncbi:DEAD/DEAH box helicase [Sansalvadorimonas verongulae]|uniref:DEAD/DEAH box helicase n=1 Tax=Sansalvadorimonas verongulae TaxID=2172824 RepID=UPI0012BC25B2|nr:DEAD/DEAH box helicase [Sansalvadorimonas verongulae]MTI13816.1 DEAD/DEAH box helicase [Sansalvadorimonas verongulae]